MKTITIILVILFLFVSIFFLVTGSKILSNIKQASLAKQESNTSITETASQTGETEKTQETTNQTQPNETYSETDENIKEINIYLDGDKNNGIFLGKAEYGLPSPDAAEVYGKDFSNFGFELLVDTSSYSFEPGTIHSLYIYALIPAYGEQYIRKEITIPGNPQVSDSIKIASDSLRENDIISQDKLKNLKIDGWALDLSSPADTGISKVEIYLDGPKNFGKLLPQVQYGNERKDVANAFGNANYINSGYNLTFDASYLEPGSNHRIYIYAFGKNGTFQYVTINFSVEGESKNDTLLISFETIFDNNNNTLKIAGWAVNKNFITQGVPRPIDVDYKIKKIVFVSNKSGNEDIWSMNIDGSELTQLTNNPESDQYPSVSPDGKKIAYGAFIGGTQQIMVMNWDGSDKKQITFGQNRHAFPSWSFDGRYIFFEMFIDDNWEVFVMESDGSNIKRLTINPGVDDWHPSAHPFLYKTLYEVGQHGSEEIWQIDINGNNKERISKGGRNYRVPKYSIDAKLITFMGYDDSKKKEQVFIMDSYGNNIKQLTFGDEGGRLPAFSPDNKYIVYNSTYGYSEIFLINIDGSGKKQLTNIPGEDSCAVFLYQAQ